MPFKKEMSAVLAKNITRQIHSDLKKRRSSCLVALLFDAGDLRRYKPEKWQTTEIIILKKS